MTTAALAAYVIRAACAKLDLLRRKCRTPRVTRLDSVAHVRLPTTGCGTGTIKDMEATAHLGTTIAWCGFALGLVFGAVGNKVNFCTMGAVSDIVNMGDWSRMRMWLLSIA